MASPLAFKFLWGWPSMEVCGPTPAPHSGKDSILFCHQSLTPTAPAAQRLQEDADPRQVGGRVVGVAGSLVVPGQSPEGWFSTPC